MTLHKVTENGTFRTLSREDIIPWVQESIIEHPNENPFDFRLSSIEAIERFAALVAAAIRARGET
jgi:hypothetical protein